MRRLGRILRRVWPLWAGALGGLGVFALEGLLILRSNAIGLHVDVRGPLAALLAAVRPALPGLLARIGLAYALVGAGVGLLSAAMTVGIRGRPLRVLVWAADFACVIALACVAKAIWRPALFDDLPFGRGLLRLLVDRAEPWEGTLALGLFVGAQLCAAGARSLKARKGSLRETGLVRLLPRAPRWTVALAAAVPLLGGACYLVERPANGPSHPLVVLFGIDAFRPDRVEGGHRQVAPHLEALLKDAARFPNAYTPIAQTEPAWRALVTARWPSRTGVRMPLNREEARRSLPTVPAALEKAGVATTFGTDCSRFNYLGPESGFSRRHEPPHGALNFLLEKLRFRLPGVFLDGALGSALLPELIDNRALAGLYAPRAYARRLARDLLAQAAKGPTFWAFHDTAAHFPGDPVYPFYRRFVPATEPLERRLRMIYAPIGKDTKGGWTREGAEALYDELLGQADTQLGIVLDALKDAGRYDDAWIIVFSDHGESFYAGYPALQGATPEHGARLGPEENRMLLVVKPPKRFGPVPKTVDALVRLIDLGPTVLDALGVGPLPRMDGKSLIGLLRGAKEPARRLYAETGFTHASPDAFEPGHFTSGPRTFDEYEIAPDGAVEMTAAAAAGALEEKDVGAFDGKGWLIDSRRADGHFARRCEGICDDGLAAFLAKNR